MGGEVKSMRKAGVLVFLVVVAAACGKPIAGPPPASGDYKLYEAAATSSSQQLAVIDSRSHAVERSLPLGVASPDWAHLYAIRSNALLDFDPQTGAVARTLQLPGYFQLPLATMSGVPGGLSQNGDWLVVESFDGATAAGSLPSATHMLVISTSTAKVIKRMDLTGDFQFDAISNDGQRLYLIQYLSNTEYNVRLFDVISGQLDANIVVDKADGNQAMAGLRLSGVASPDGHWLYSMYVREHQSPFIHALSMDGPFAFCIDLPGNGYASGNGADEFHWSLAMSRDGSRLYAANGALGLVADVEPATNYQPAVKRIAHIGTAGSAGVLVQNAQAKELGANAATVTPDGRTLVIAGGDGVVWIDTRTLSARDHALTDWRVWSLALSADGNQLYVVNDAGLIAETSMAQDHVTTKFGGAPGQPIALIRVAGGGA
jgi:hypothetical protein